MGKSSSAPPAPDYAAAARQTAAGNLAMAQLGQSQNMVNQYTPQGSVTYSQKQTGWLDPGTGKVRSLEDYATYSPETQADISANWTPVNQWSQNVTLSPEQQAAYDKDVQMNAALQDVGIQGVGYVQSALNKPLGAPDPLTRNVKLSDFTQDIGTQAYQKDIANAGNIQREMVSPELLQQQVTDALYKQQTQYLDPQFQQSQAKLENQLANQGITRGSEAWNNAMNESARQKQQAYESARQGAIGQGVSAASTMYGNQLSGGQFVNQSQQQQFLQNQAQQQAYNQAQQAAFDQMLANANLKNTAQSQLYNQGLSNAQLRNAAIQQEFQNAQTLRNDPINMLNAVRSGSQMQVSQQPQTSVSAPGQMATVSGPDYLSAATAQGQYNQGLYNAQNASQSNMTGGLMQLGGTAMMAYAM